eukprot:GFUD01041464.1.p1 GENE.GFUD01041464.1~~GFUD01041464.1.p1  ORF type:complete len:469 (-),score=85.70 GFUD01041464.1:99-1505(-)
MQVFLQRRSSWVDSASLKSFTARCDQVNLQSGDGQTISLPVSLLVAGSPFLLSLLPPPCLCCTNTTTISLPSTRGFSLKLLAQVFSAGETEQLPGEIINSSLEELQEVLELLETGIVLRTSYTALDSLQVATVESFTVSGAAAVTVNDEFEISESRSDLIGEQDVWELNPDSSKERDGVPSDRGSFSELNFQEASMDFKVKLKKRLVSQWQTRKNYQDLLKIQSKSKKKEYRCLNCSFCDRNFKKIKSLMNHVKERHSNKGSVEKNHCCQKCELNYSSLHNLERHIHLKHGGRMKENEGPIDEGLEYQHDSSIPTANSDELDKNRGFQCTDCGRSYFTEKGLQKHKNKRHNKEQQNNLLRCPSCGLRFLDDSSMKKHSKKHINTANDSEEQQDLGFRCSECHESFKSKKGVAIHIKRVHERVIFACGVCDKIALYKSRIYEHCKVFSHSKGLIYEIRDREKDETDGLI